MQVHDEDILSCVSGGFIRRVSGGMFQVKVADGREIQTNHYM